MPAHISDHLLDPTDLRRRLWLVLGLVMALRLVAIGLWPLSGDEAYHWEWAANPSLGYYDHPPLHAWTMALTTAIFGHNAWAVRLPNVLAGLAMALVLATWTRRLGEACELSPPLALRAGTWAGILATICPIHTGLAVYATGDALASLHWALTAWAFWAAMEQPAGKIGAAVGRWVLAGALFGLCIQTKFLTMLLPGFVGLALIINATHRRWLLRWEPWLSIPAAGVVAGSLIWWNSQNDWATFVFNFASRHYVMGLWYLEIPRFFGSQIAVVTPLLWIAGVWAALRAISFRHELRYPATRYLALMILVPLAAFSVNALSKKIGLHWPAVAYVGVYALVPLWWELAQVGKRWRQWTVGIPAAITILTLTVACISPTLSVLPFMPAAPVITSMEASTDNDAPATGEVLGWSELGRVVTERQQAWKQGDTPVTLVAAQYGFVASLRFYIPGQPEVLLWERPGHHGQQHRMWDTFSDHADEDLLFVTRKSERINACRDALLKHCTDVGPTEAHDIIVDGRVVNRIWMIPCRGFDGQMPTW